MEAYEIVKVKGEDKFCSFSGCSSNGLIKFAIYRINLIGYFYGYACKDCTKRFKRLWKLGHDGPVDETT